MEIKNTIEEQFKKYFGKKIDRLEVLPRSGSDRRYYRIFSANETYLGAYNPVKEENEAFVGFTRHFKSCGLPVPGIFHYLPEKNIYFLEDLGDTNLYTWLQSKRVGEGIDGETMEFYKKVLGKLLLFQVDVVKGLDLSLCYPHKKFDRQSMLWDLNYFKYMYLKLLAVPFNESGLERDFNVLIDFLLGAQQECFLYRDFQTANIMVVGAEPWFIDYQGGRLGAPQYDLASLLYDAKIPMRQTDRDELLSFYVDIFNKKTGFDGERFRAYYSGFSLIRVMQACGAFGFRGLYEKKPTFTESVVPGGLLLGKIMDTAAGHVDLPELAEAINRIPKTPVFISLTQNHGA